GGVLSSESDARARPGFRDMGAIRLVPSVVNCTAEKPESLSPRPFDSVGIAGGGDCVPCPLPTGRELPGSYRVAFVAARGAHRSDRGAAGAATASLPALLYDAGRPRRALDLDGHVKRRRRDEAAHAPL